MIVYTSIQSVHPIRLDVLIGIRWLAKNKLFIYSRMIYLHGKNSQVKNASYADNHHVDNIFIDIDNGIRCLHFE